MNLDPIRPYLSLIKTGLIVALLCGTFVAGCNHGKREIPELQLAVATLARANVQWADIAKEAERQKVANQTFAREQFKLAEASAKQVSELREQTHKTITTLEDQLEEAKRKPECAELLKQHFCAAVPLYSSP